MNLKAFFSKLGQTFMLPIALLPAAGIMLGIGGSFTNQSMVEAYGLQSALGEGTLLNNFLGVISAAGDIVFANLPVMFAIALAIGFAKKEKGAAALAALMSYLIMNVAISETMAVFNIVTETCCSIAVSRPTTSRRSPKSTKRSSAAIRRKR